MNATKRPRDLVVAHPVAERMPLVGRLRMGHKDADAMFPRADDHFRAAPDDSGITSETWAAAFHQVCGEKPREIKILLPGPAPGDILRGAYKLYGTSKLKRRCDGETCNERLAAGGWAEKPCVCQARAIPEKVTRKGKLVPNPERCQLSWSFQFILQDVPGLGAADLVTGSEISARNLATRLHFFHQIVGDLRLFPCVLFMTQVAVSPEGQTKKVWVLDLRDDGTWTPRQAIAGEVRPALELQQRVEAAGELPPAPVERDDDRDELVHRDSTAPASDEIPTAAAATETLLQRVADAIGKLDDAHKDILREKVAPTVRAAAARLCAQHGERAATELAGLLDEIASKSAASPGGEVENVDPSDVTVEQPASEQEGLPF
jgi:hypothetical protein